MNNIDAILYINLAHREDRNTHIQHEISKICTEQSKIHRIDAIQMENGALGCSLSHIKTIEYMLEHDNWNTCLILEDDFTFRTDDSDDLDRKLSSFFDNFKDFDMCLLSSCCLVYSTSYENDIKKVISSQTTSSYILRRAFAPTLLENMKESSNDMRINGKCYHNHLDMHWKILQPNNSWFVFEPALGYQCPSYSDIEQNFVSYGR